VRVPILVGAAQPSAFDTGFLTIDTMSTTTIQGFTDDGGRIMAKTADDDDGHCARPTAVSVEDWYTVDAIIDFVKEGGYHRVALQFPDHLLPDAPGLVASLHDRLSETVRCFVLGDTSFASCCVDEVAAGVRRWVCVACSITMVP